MTNRFFIAKLKGWKERRHAGHREVLRNSDQDALPRAWRTTFPAIYGEFNGVFEVATLEMIEGDLPQRAQRLIREWAEQYKGELERMWKTQDYQKLPGLE
jgi:hypothetical protein